MSIWNNLFSLEALNEALKNTACESLGIVFTSITDDTMVATMPVDTRTIQPMGLLHGGSSVVLAESLGSTAANMAVPKGYICVGLDINANHIRSARSGIVTGVARAIHIGRTTQVWEINITDEQDRLVCVSRLTVAVKKL